MPSQGERTQHFEASADQSCIGKETIPLSTSLLLDVTFKVNAINISGRVSGFSGLERSGHAHKVATVDGDAECLSLKRFEGQCSRYFAQISEISPLSFACYLHSDEH